MKFKNKMDILKDETEISCVKVKKLFLNNSPLMTFSTQWIDGNHRFTNFFS